MKIFYLFGFVLAALLSGQALSDECARNTGPTVSLDAADAQFLSSAVEMFKNKKRQELLAISDKKLQLIRRYGSGVDARGGNLWEELTPRQIDRNLWIHIGKRTLPSYLGEGDVHIGEQVIKDFSPKWFDPKADGTGISIGRKICDGASHCDGVPVMNEIETLIDRLLSCNNNKNAAFVFSDGILLTDMKQYEWAGLPIGGAVFFSKTATGYKLHTLISFQ